MPIDSASHAGEGLPPLPQPIKDTHRLWRGPATEDQYNREREHEAKTVAGYTADQMRAYATAAVMQERERCAKVCEALVSFDGDWDTSNWNQAVQRCALAIRADTKREPESGTE